MNDVHSNMDGPYVLMASGQRFEFDQPEPEMIDPHDIAHHLAMIPRFTGATRWHYSVAQHSFLVSLRVPKEHALQALLHDASEAYLNDIAMPLKHHRIMKEYRALETRVQRMIYLKFGVEPVMHRTVKQADLVMLATEKRDLMPVDSKAWPVLRDVKASPVKIHEWSWQDARSRWLERFELLIARRDAEQPLEVAV